MSLVRRSAVFTGAQVVVVGVGLVTSILISRWLGPHGRGVLALVNVIAATTALMATLGLGTAYTFLAGKRTHPYERVVGHMVVTAVASGAATAGLLVAFSGPLRESVLKGLTAEELAITAASVPFVYLGFFFSSFMLGAGDAERVAYVQVGGGFATLSLIVAVVVVAHRGVLGAVVVTAVVAMLGALSYLVVGVRRYGISFRGLRPINAFATAYGAKTYLGLLSSQFWLRADVLILNFYAGPNAVGEYAVATSIAEQVWVLDSSVSQAVVHEVIGSSTEEAGELVAKTTRNVALLAGASCVAIGAVAPWVVPILFGHFFKSAVAPLWLLLPGVLAVAIARPISSFFYGQLGKPGFTSAVSAVTAVVGVGAYFALVPSFGASGAAVGSSFAYVVPLLAYVPRFARTTGIAPRDMLLVNRDDARMYRRLVRSALARPTRTA